MQPGLGVSISTSQGPSLMSRSKSNPSYAAFSKLFELLCLLLILVFELSKPVLVIVIQGRWLSFILHLSDRVFQSRDLLALLDYLGGFLVYLLLQHPVLFLQLLHPVCELLLLQPYSRVGFFAASISVLGSVFHSFQ